MAADITYPAELGVWLLEGHAFDAVPLTEDMRFERGEDRVRQLYRSVPQIASVSALFSQTLYDRWVEFYEDELYAGTQSFNVRVKSQVADTLAWWTAQIIAPPQETVQAAARGLLYRVSLQLLLLDGPRDEADPTSSLLLESGDVLLLEGGDALLLEGLTA